MQYFLDNGVSTKPGIMNAHQQKAYSEMKNTLPESEKARDEVILLPVFKGLSEEDIKRICKLFH
jgi:dTDP-4-amino-4,6-dideoxygalactose transaminase